MALQPTAYKKPSITPATPVSEVMSVDGGNVTLHDGHYRESLRTKGTAVRLLPSVSPHMSGEVGPRTKPSGTLMTLVVDRTNVTLYSVYVCDN